jgi:hypothetical protein
MLFSSPLFIHLTKLKEPGSMETTYEDLPGHEHTLGAYLQPYKRIL